MRFALLIGFVVAVLGQRSAPVCFPPSCTLDSHCTDSIHDIKGRCCGGVCSLNFYSGRLAGQSCTPTGEGESCAGSCAGGLFCSNVDERCHSLHGLGCNCTEDEECLSSYCRTAPTPGAQRTCGGFNLDINETCVANSECTSRLCFNSLCSTLVLGAPCSLSGAPCDAPNFCRANATGSNVCSARCALNEAGCCTQSNHCLPQPAGVSCTANTCQIPPGNGELCTDQTGCRNDTGPLLCATLCNDTATPPYSCSFNTYCQPYSTLPYGAICSQSSQCSGAGAACLSNGTYLVCTPPIPLGESCGSSTAWPRCASPGNMCQYNGSGYVCKQNGTTPVNASCYTDSTGRNLQECAPGSMCAYDSTGASPTSYVCTPLTPLNATCTSANQCAPPGNLCNYVYGSTSQYVCKQRNTTAVGELCSYYPSNTECVSPATCMYNGSYYVCTPPPPPKQLGEYCGGTGQIYWTNCAPPGNMCLPNATSTYVCKANGTTPFFSSCTVDNTGRNLDECLAPSKCRYSGTTGLYTCTPPVALGGVCDTLGYASSSIQYNYGLCASPGNMCSWNGTYGICKQNGTTPLGAACYPDYRLNECAGNSTCQLNQGVSTPTGYSCTPPPTPIPLGQPCGSISYYYRCAAPGDMCIPSATSPTPVCTKSRTTPLGATCTPDSYSYKDECVNGTSCANDGSKYTCQSWLKGGSQCSTYSNTNLKCDIGCVADPSVCSGPCYTSSSCCTCLSKNVPDGKPCYDSRQCLGEYSSCDSSTKTCKSIVGQDCQTASDCGNTYKFDCSCSTQQCYVLNAPTPVPATRAPTAPTATRAPTPARCDSQLAAWYRVTPPDFDFVNATLARYYSNYVSFDNFAPEVAGSSSFVSQALMLNTSAKVALIDLACCLTCPLNYRFNSFIYRGYQVDCGAKTLTRLPDTCNDLRDALAFVNCWDPIISSASSLSISVGAVLALITAALW